MSESIDFDSFARDLSFIYDDASELKKVSPVYSELKHLSSRYSDAQEIAQGGMKSILKVFDHSTSRHIALAELRPHVEEDEYEAFLREARLTALLEHPNIISIHDIGLHDDGRPYFTMDLKTGDTLRDILQKLNLGDKKYLTMYHVDDLLLMFLKICDATAYAHSRGIIHLDLKPENIQVGGYGEVLVCDWGLGKVIGEPDTPGLNSVPEKDLLNNMTCNDTIKGTPGYMAPEQILENGVKDNTTDIYALGGILYALLSFCTPIKGDIKEILKKTVSGEINLPVNSQLREIPNSLKAVVMRALSLNKCDRYQSVEGLRKDIEKYMSGFSTEAENAGIIKELQLFVRRNRTISLVCATAVIIIISITLVFVDRVREEARVAVVAKNEAVASADKYRKERNKTRELAKDLAEKHWDQTMYTTDLLIFSHPVESIERSLEHQQKFLYLSPDNDKVKRHLAYTLFLKQDFTQAKAYSVSADKQTEDLFVLAEKYAPKLQQSGLLNTTDFGNLIIDLSKEPTRRYLAEKMVIYYLAITQQQVTPESLFNALVKIFNPKWDMTQLEYNAAEKSLQVNHPAIVSLRIWGHNASELSIPRFLNIDKLSLSQSGVNNLRELLGLNITELDITNTWINDLSEISQFKSLNTLKITKSQFTDRQLSNIPPRITVIIK